MSETEPSDTKLFFRDMAVFSTICLVLGPIAIRGLAYAHDELETRLPEPTPIIVDADQ